MTPRRAFVLLSLLGVTSSAAAAPVLSEPAAAAGPEWRYTLRPSDTLIDVSARYLARPHDWARVQRYNRIGNPYQLTPGSTLRIPLAWLRHEPAPATVLAVTGVATLTLPDAAARPLKSGEQLASGAMLATAANSSATLRFADGSVVVLQPGARMTLDTVSVYSGGGKPLWLTTEARDSRRSFSWYSGTAR